MKCLDLDERSLQRYLMIQPTFSIGKKETEKWSGSNLCQVGSKCIEASV